MHHLQIFHNSQLSFSEIDAPPHSIGVISGYMTKYYNPLDQGTNYNVFGNTHIRIAPGAFDGVLSSNPDIKFFVQHDMRGIPFGRTGAGTGKVWQMPDGIMYSLSLPDSPMGHNLKTAVLRGDLSSSSFTANIGFKKWTQEGKANVMTIHRFAQLLEISPVADPAFSSTRGLQIAASLESDANRAFAIQARIELSKK